MTTPPARAGFRGMWATVGGHRIFARVSAGSAAAPPVVLVHGLGVSGRYLMPTARLLAPSHPTFVPDLPGFGRSPRPHRPLDIPRLADALAGWMRRAGLGPACLVANSLGCQVVADLAVRYPELVGWAVLVGPTGDPTARTLTALIGRGLADLPAEPLSLWPLLAWDYLAAGPVRMLTTLRLALADPVAGKLPRVPAPTLVVRGSWDPIAPRRWVGAMAGALPRGRAAELSGGTHAANYSAPAALARVVRDWVTAHPAGPGRGRRTG